MKIDVSATKNQLGQKAADQGAEWIRDAIASHGQATIVVATGASQFDTLAALTESPGVDWSRVTGFHLDEYLGLPESHPASFRGYLKQRFVDKVPLKAFHYIDGESDPIEECERLGALIRDHIVDVAFIGIGENGHLAFNDPPADFETQQPYLRVQLDEACRRQQCDEGWFDTLTDVPTHAISMSVKQIMKSARIVCSVPDSRKAEAVKATVCSLVSPAVPASILQQHDDVVLYLDQEAASLLPAKKV